MIEDRLVNGHAVRIDHQIGMLSVSHDGDITWDILQAIKCAVWGDEAVAYEVYPPTSRIVNSQPMRHLWRLGEGEFYPDLLGPDVGHPAETLQSRYARAWAEAV